MISEVILSTGISTAAAAAGTVTVQEALDAAQAQCEAQITLG